MKSSSWGDTANTLNTLYGGAQGSTNATQDSQGGSVGVSLGVVNFGGSAQHASTTNTGQGSNYNNASAFSRNSATFDGTTLTINGAQVIAFVSDIVPPSPTMDDPSLRKQTTSATIAGPATATPAPAAGG